MSLEPELPPRRTLVEEVASLPIVTSATEKVSATHGMLCRFVPLYGLVTSAALSTTRSITERAEEYPVVRSSVEKVEEFGLRAVDNFRSSYPIIDKPTDEVLEGLYLLVRQRAGQGSRHIAAFRFAQITCRAAEAAMSAAERLCVTLLLLEQGAALERVLPRRLKKVYIMTVRQLLSSAERYLKRGRRAVQSWRRSGVNFRVGKERIRRRRKVTPRKRGARPEEHGWMTRCMRWVSLSAATSRTLSRQAEGIEDHQLSSNIEEPSEDRRSHHSEDDDSCVNEPRLTLRDLMALDFTSNCSENDPDYSPSETLTDSLEYRSTNGEVETPFTEDDFSDRKEGAECPTDDEGAVEESIPLVVVTMAEEGEDVTPSNTADSSKIAHRTD